MFSISCGQPSHLPAVWDILIVPLQSAHHACGTSSPLGSNLQGGAQTQTHGLASVLGPFAGESASIYGGPIHRLGKVGAHY